MEEWNSVGGTVWCKSGIVLVELVEQCLLEEWNSDGGRV